MSKREWIAYCTVDGEPWAVFLRGHDHDLRVLQSTGCKAEITSAFQEKFGWPASALSSNDFDIGRWWIRNQGKAAEDPERPWEFCEMTAPGAIPITGARFS